jgi:hypothetical protein
VRRRGVADRSEQLVDCVWSMSSWCERWESGPARLPSTTLGEDRPVPPRPAAQGVIVVVQAGPLLSWSTGQQERNEKGGHGWDGEGGTGTAVAQSSSRPVMRADKLSPPQRVCLLAWQHSLGRKGRGTYPGTRWEGREDGGGHGHGSATPRRYQ